MAMLVLPYNHMNQSAEVRAYYELPISILVDRDCLDSSLPIYIGGFKGILLLPGVQWTKGQ